MSGLIPAIFQYRSFRRYSFPRPLPFSLTFNLTNRCNCRCRTCNIFNDPRRELSLEEIRKIFRSFKGRVPWLTLTGGEPFLREDLAAICEAACTWIRPQIINIPTNAVLTDTIRRQTEEILGKCRGSVVILNMSLDGTGERQDELRGKKGSYEDFLRTFQALRPLRGKNFRIGINTTLSRHNAGDLHAVIREVEKMAPDSHIIECAQRRFELHNEDMDFQIDAPEYVRCAEEIVKTPSVRKDRFSKVVKTLRKRYYQLTGKVLTERRRILPCFAGFASAQIASDGDVWACCFRGDLLGNLREAGYDFRKVWFGPQAAELRERLKKMNCFCTGSNINYLNMLFDAKQSAGLFAELVRGLFQ